MAGTIQAGTLISSNSRSIDVDDIGVRSYAGGGGAFNYRNKIIDGRFDFWYEGTSQTSGGYGSDTMWLNNNSGSTKTHSQQTLTAGVDLPAIECPTATYFSRTVVTSVAAVGNRVMKAQNIENVGSLAGKTVTLSFYAKADAVKNIAVELGQSFGSSGSTAVTGIGSQLVSLSTAWKRYSVTIDVPSISGKTVGTGSFLGLVFWFDAETTTYGTRSANLGQQSGTFDITCVQLEEGSVATPFEELPIEVSQMRVNRYYQRFGGLYGSVASYPILYSPSMGGVFYNAYIQLNGTMRSPPVFSTSLSDSNFAVPNPYFTDGQWGLVLDGYAWVSKNGAMAVAINGTLNTIHLQLYVSGTLNITPSAIYMVGSTYMAADARL